jgi:hypothetical protein
LTCMSHNVLYKIGKNRIKSPGDAYLRVSPTKGSSLAFGYAHCAARRLSIYKGAVRFR